MILVSSIPRAANPTPVDAKSAVFFHVKKRLKLWVVLRDNAYAGSYADEASAHAAAQKQVDAINSGGAAAELVCASNE